MNNNSRNATIDLLKILAEIEDRTEAIDQYYYFKVIDREKVINMIMQLRYTDVYIGMASLLLLIYKDSPSLETVGNDQLVAELTWQRYGLALEFYMKSMNSCE